MKSLPKGLLIALGFMGLALFIFRVVLPEGVVLQSIDYNYGLMAMYKSELPGAFFEGFWRGFPLLGRVGSTPPTLTNLLLAVLPIEFYMDWIYPILLLISSGFLIGFLRLRKLDWIPTIAGALIAFWLGSNLTLILPGHLLKYGVLACAAATLFSLEKFHQTLSWRWAVLSGGALGWMFMHQADLALFFGLVLGAFHLFRTSEVSKKDLPKFGTLSLLLLFVAGLIVWESFQTQMETQVRNVDVLQQGSEEEKWDFATQWSFPPQESLDLIAPGFWGWNSTHEKVPYHGITGQSAEWENRQRGFPNLRMESVYVGILPIGLAFLAWFSYRTRKRELLFWSIALAVSLLLSFGKFTPLYRVFFELPLVNVIRNPNKFLQVAQVCLGILSAFGLQALLQTCSPKQRKCAARGFLVISLGLVVGSLIINPISPTQTEAFAGTPWVQKASAILLQRQIALLHASVLGGWSAACLLCMKYTKWRSVAGPGLITALVLDVALLGQHYLKPQPVKFIQENALATFLKQEIGHQRVAVLQQDGLSNFYLTQLFPAHQIPFAEIAAAPRLEESYQRYFEAIGTNRLRMWQEFGVSHVLASRALAEHLMQQIPSLRQALTEAWSYSLMQKEKGQLEIIPGTPNRPGDFLVLEFQLPSERFTLIGNAISATEEQSLEAISSGENAFEPLHVHSSEFEAMSSKDSPGKIKGILATPQGFLLNIQVDAPRAFLRLSDRYTPALRARLNQQDPIPLHPVDVLFTGIELPQGVHEVEIFFTLPSAARRAQAAGLFICFLVAVSLPMERRISSVARLGKR